MKKLLLAMMAVVLATAVSVSMAPSAFAAPAYGTVKVSVTQNYSTAQKVLKLVNSKRAKAHLSKLKMDKSLTKSAIQRAAEVGIYVPWTSPHRRPNGKLSKSVNGKIVYECCAEGYQTAEDTVKGWMGSPSHRAGILLKSAKSVGIACVTTGYGDTIWVLDFSNSKAKKVQKSKKVVSSTKTVKAKSTYLKSKFFSGMLWSGDEIGIGESDKVLICYASKYNVTRTSISPKSFKWTSSNDKVATVTKSGVVKANGVGTATLKGTLKKGPKVTVKVKVNVVDYQSEY